MADILHQKCSFEYFSVDGRLCIRVALAAGGSHLLVCVEINFIDIEPGFRSGGSNRQVFRLVDVYVGVFIVGDVQRALVPVAERRGRFVIRHNFIGNDLRISGRADSQPSDGDIERARQRAAFIVAEQCKKVVGGIRGYRAE